MKLHSLFAENTIKVGLESDDFGKILRELVESVAEDLAKAPVEEIAQRLLEREREDPTILNDFACLAHLRLPEAKAFRAAAAMPANPVAHPGKPDSKLRLIFLLLAPQEQNTLMLQSMKAVTRLLESKPFLSAYRGAKTPARLLRLIEESGFEVKRNLTASDVMEPVEISVGLDTPIPEAVEAISRAPDEGVPVVDEKGRLQGEITSKEILQFGMPKYMDLLSNPAMLNAFEPFENYFRGESEARVRDICRRDYIAVAPGDPIVQVAHTMITRNRRRVYVIADEKIEGVIYRKAIVQRVMHR